MTKPRAPRGSSSLALPLLWLASVVLLLLLAALDMRLGSRLIGWNDIIAFPTRPDTLVQAILETSRAPRVVAAILTGAALAAAGSVLQSVLRNPLAAPDILSVTSGAQLMLVISTLLLPVAVPSIIATTGGGLTGALACIALAGGFVPHPAGSPSQALPFLSALPHCLPPSCFWPMTGRPVSSSGHQAFSTRRGGQRLWSQLQ